MNTKQLSALLFFSFFSLTTLCSQEASSTDSFAELPQLESLIPSLSSEDKNTLQGEHSLLRFHGEGMSPNLIPETSLAAPVVRSMFAGNLNIGIEGLFFYPTESLPQSYTSMNPQERELTLYNILRSVSTLQGLEYYSASRGEMRLLFEESWAIANEKDITAQPNPLVSTIPPSDEIFIYQKDKSFGKNRYTMGFEARPDAMAIEINNLTPLRYAGFIKVVDSQAMQIHLIVVPTQEGLLLYGAMAARTANIKAFRDKARSSFTNRVIAITEWYRQRLGEEFL
ncbi:MAG: hypothetical protein MI717_14605 [Spirochaetales bacterium]|nr:hypothetical protein [Spirochaetales bacterium]